MCHGSSEGSKEEEALVVLGKIFVNLKILESIFESYLSPPRPPTANVLNGVRPRKFYPWIPGG